MYFDEKNNIYDMYLVIRNYVTYSNMVKMVCSWDLTEDPFYRACDIDRHAIHVQDFDSIVFQLVDLWLLTNNIIVYDERDFQCNQFLENNIPSILENISKNTKATKRVKALAELAIESIENWKHGKDYKEIWNKAKAIATCEVSDAYELANK